jgi:hypothetical protein
VDTLIDVEPSLIRAKMDDDRESEANLLALSDAQRGATSGLCLVVVEVWIPTERGSCPMRDTPTHDAALSLGRAAVEITA